jgi:hypothetical protein
VVADAEESPRDVSCCLWGAGIASSECILPCAVDERLAHFIYGFSLDDFLVADTDHKNATKASDVTRKRSIKNSFPSASTEANTSYITSRVGPTMTNNTNRANFYNVFIPLPGVGSGPENAIRIVKEQFEQVQESGVKDAPVYYTLIGYNQTENVFDDPNFHLTQYMQEGSNKSRSRLYMGTACKHPAARVSCIHDKGSFHLNEGNKIRRRYVTKASFAEALSMMVK